MKNKNVGKRIKDLLKENGITQIKVAKATGKTQSVISDIINGRRDCDELVNQLSSLYGWSRDYLMDGVRNNREDFIANSDNSNKGLTKEEKIKLIENLQGLYKKHQELLNDASQVMKEIAAINRILIME